MLQNIERTIKRYYAGKSGKQTLRILKAFIEELEFEHDRQLWPGGYLQALMEWTALLESEINATMAYFTVGHDATER